MNGGPLLVIVGLLALAALLPAAAWHHRGPLPHMPTRQLSAGRIAACQRFSAGWNPQQSNRTLRRWEHCMKIPTT